MSRSVPWVAPMFAVHSCARLTSEAGGTPWYQTPAPAIAVTSGDNLGLTFGDILLAISIMLVLVDLLQSYHVRATSLWKHIWTFVLFVTSVVLFFTTRGFGNAGFMNYTLLVLCDLTAGVLILVTARRDLPYRLPEELE